MSLKIILFALGVWILVADSAFSATGNSLNTKPSSLGISVKIPECTARPDFLYQNKTPVNLTQLPQLILVGKRAEHYVESKNSKFRLYGEQSFTRAKSRIVCGTAREQESESFSIFAPTILNFSSEKPVANSVWQFQMIANPKEFGIWNQQSRILSQAGDLEKKLSEIGGKVQFFQISHDEYEMVISKETDKALEYLAIRFDAVSKL